MARVKKLEKEGVQHLMLTPPEAAYDKIMEAWAKEVMPHSQSPCSEII